MKYIYTFILCCFAFNALAEREANKSLNDPRIRTVSFNPMEVYPIKAYFGIGTTIQFDPTEIIEGSPIMGMAGAWQVIPQDFGRVSLKPLVKDGHTNLTIFTNKRTYNFELKVAKQKSAYVDVDNSDITFMLYFNYPEDANQMAYERYRENIKRKQQASLQECSSKQGLVNPTSLNYNYLFSGSRRIAPIIAFDDGEFIYLQFHKKTPIPSVFGVDHNNDETTLNTRMSGSNYLIIEQLAERLTLRYGDEVVTIVKDEGQREKDTKLLSKRKKEEKGGYNGW